MHSNGPLSPSLRLILFTMVLRQNLLHKIALEYHGNIFQYKFVTVEKNLNTNFQKCSQMFVLICHCGGTCLIRILLLNNSKYSKYQTIACLLFCVLIIYTFKVKMYYETFALICHCGGTC